MNEKSSREKILDVCLGGNAWRETIERGRERESEREMKKKNHLGSSACYTPD